MKPTAVADERELQLKVTLLGTKPPVWRRLLVREGITLADLHQAIQLSMGWFDCHLYSFEVKGRSYTTLRVDPFPDDLDTETTGLRELRLRNKGTKLRYVYDFGDDWTHQIEVEAVSPLDPGAAYPRCLAGRRACPPEDCGGPSGYARLLEAAADTRHPEHAEMEEWLGRRFDPARFDIDEANAALARLGARGAQPRLF